ncbi:MAG: hypothetical protein WD273_01055 [Trueperaceae bacterium]
MKAIIGAFLALGILAVAFAQDQGSTSVEMMESEEYGPYLTDAEGRTLYLFINEEGEAGDERMTEGVRMNAAPCAGGCLNAWPPLTGEVEAGEGVDEELLYTADVGGTMMAVYNGWPLYYFANDTEPGQTNGQARGSAPTIWYIVSPEGHPVENEE